MRDKERKKNLVKSVKKIQRKAARERDAVRVCVCARGGGSSQDIRKTVRDDRLRPRRHHPDNLPAYWTTGAPFDPLVMISMQQVQLAGSREQLLTKTRACVRASVCVRLTAST